MPSKTPKYSPEEFANTFADTTVFCKENSISIVASQMARDMLKIKELEASIRELKALKTEPNEPIEWRVRWVIEVDGNTPREAALAALEIHRDPESTATFFTVENVETGESFNIDLLLD